MPKEKWFPCPFWFRDIHLDKPDRHWYPSAIRKFRKLYGFAAAWE